MSDKIRLVFKVSRPALQPGRKATRKLTPGINSEVVAYEVDCPPRMRAKLDGAEWSVIAGEVVAGGGDKK